MISKYLHFLFALFLLTSTSPATAAYRSYLDRESFILGFTNELVPDEKDAKRIIISGWDRINSAISKTEQDIATTRTKSNINVGTIISKFCTLNAPNQDSELDAILDIVEHTNKLKGLESNRQRLEKLYRELRQEVPARRTSLVDQLYAEALVELDQTKKLTKKDRLILLFQEVTKARQEREELVGPMALVRQEMQQAVQTREQQQQQLEERIMTLKKQQEAEKRAEQEKQATLKENELQEEQARMLRINKIIQEDQKFKNKAYLLSLVLAFGVVIGYKFLRTYLNSAAL